MLNLVKRAAKSVMKATPYKIVRREEGDLGGEVYDALSHNSLENMDALFGDAKFLKNYVSATRARLHTQTAALAREAKAPSEVKVVGDFGCGPADFFNDLQPDYSHCAFYGYDFANATLEAGRARFPAATFQQYDLYTPPPRQHDLTICSQTIEHLENPELALKHLIEATAPGGVLLVTVPDGRADTYCGHINFWSPESWKTWIDRNVSQRHETRYIPTGKGKTGNLAAIIWQEG